MKLIQLSNTDTSSTPVSDEDYEKLAAYRWRLSPYGYACRTKNQSSRLLHREVMESILRRKLRRDELVDHIDKDKLNNQRSKLRLATHGQNHANSRPRRDFYKGVYREGSRWVASINFGSKKYWIGSSTDPREAAWMYDQYAIELHGEFAATNFNYV